MGSLSSWTEAANKAAETYKAPASASLSGSLSIGNLNAAKQSEIPQPYKAPGGDLFDTSTASTFSPQSLNVGRFYDHPGYKRLKFSAYRDNDAYYNKHTSGIGDFTRAMKNFGPGFWGGFASNYNGLASILGGEATSPSRLDFTKGRKAEEAASRAMSTRGGFKQSATNIVYNLNYTLGIAASIAAEDIALAALAPETAGGSLVVAAGRTIGGAGKVVKSIYNVARGARAFDKVADAKKLYTLARSGVTGAGRVLIPETATQFGKFYRAAGAAGDASRVGSATLNMFKTAQGFGSMYRDLRMISLAVDESSVEAAGVRSSLMDQLSTEFTSKYGRIPTPKEYAEMRAIADKGLAADYWSNLPVIYLTNKLTFGNASLAPRFLKNFAAPIKTQGGRLLYTATGGKVASEIVERTLNPVKYIKRAVTNRKLAKANLYATAKYFKANLGEGVQELYQTGAATTFEDYYKNLYDDPRMTGFKHYKESARKGVGSLVSQEGLEAFLGGVLGGGAINMGGKIARLGKEYVMKTTSPNQYEALKKNQLDELKAVNDLINEEGSNVLKFLSPDITNLVELIKDNGTAYEFAEADNFKGIEDIRATSLYKKIQQLESAGATDTFIDALEQMKMMEADEKMDALGVDTVEKADKLIDVISERTKVIRSNIDYVNKNYENPYNPNDYEVGTQERNEEILKQFAWEQAKKDLAFNFNQFTVTAERLGEIYNSAVRDGAVSDMSNKDFSVLFNTSLAESKKSGAVFESSLENEIGFLSSEKANVSAELSNIIEQSKTASDEGKQQLDLRKTQLQDKLKKLTKRETSLVKYAAAAEKVKASRATLKEGVERPSEEEALKDLKSAFEAYMIQIGEENNTPVNKLKLDETFSKLLDFIDVAEDNRLASNAITILSDPAAVKRLSDIHFDGIKKRFEAHVGLSKMLAFGFVESKRVNEYIEALEEIGVVVPVKEMQALILEGTVPTQYISIAKIDVDANGFVIEGTPLWDQIQEISDQYEMGRAETEADLADETEQPQESKFEDRLIPLKREVIRVKSDDGSYVDYTVTTMLDGSLKASSISYDENGNETGRNTSVKLKDGLIALDAVKISAAKEDVVTIESTESGEDFMNPKKKAALTSEQKKKLGIEEPAVKESSEPVKVLYQRLYGTAYQKNRDGSGLVEVEVKVAEYPEDQLDIITFETKIVTKKGETRTTQEKRYETAKQFMTDLNLTEEDIKNFTVPVSKELGESLLEEYGQDVLNLNRRENAGEKEGYSMPLSTFLKLQQDNRTGTISLREIIKDLENNVDVIQILGYHSKITFEVPRKPLSTQTGRSRNFDEQAAASQQASKETVGEEKKTKRTAPVKAKYQAAALRKELSGTEVLEKLEADFKAENTRLRKEGKGQQTFVEFINGLENIDELVSEGRDQASEVSRSKSAAKKVQDFERQLKRARTVEEVDLIEVNAQTLPFIKSSDISKLDFEKRRNEIMAAAAKEEGMQNVPEPTPAQQAPEGDNLDQATTTVETIDFNTFDTSKENEEGGEIGDDINDILC